jgi:hypothetical protein
MALEGKFGHSLIGRVTYVVYTNWILFWEAYPVKNRTFDADSFVCVLFSYLYNSDLFGAD